MNQETITALLLAALCSAACSSTSFGVAMREDGGPEGDFVEEMIREAGHDGGVEGGEEDAETTPEEGGDSGDSGVDVEELEGGVDAGVADAEDAADAREEEAAPERPDPCLSDSECAADAFCRWGICTHICPCGESTTCRPSASGAPLCLPLCSFDTDCVSTMSCVDGACTDPRDL